MSTERTTTKTAARMAKAFLPEFLETPLDPAIAAAVAGYIQRNAVHIGYLPQKNELVITFNLEDDGEGEPAAQVPGQRSLEDVLADPDDDRASWPANTNPAGQNLAAGDLS